MIKFERIAPDRVQIGDILMCSRHDDQWERVNTRVVGIERDDTPGAHQIGEYSRPYAYRIWLTCRHISLKRLDAAGGPEYRWHLFPWNGVTRYA
jgi:hypothetical protein